MVSKSLNGLLKRSKLLMKVRYIISILLCLSSGILSSQNTPSYIDTSELELWYPFNGNALDQSGNNRNATVNGASLTSDRNGISNSAYSFDGIDDYIEIPFDLKLNSANHD